MTATNKCPNCGSPAKRNGIPDTRYVMQTSHIMGGGKDLESLLDYVGRYLLLWYDHDPSCADVNVLAKFDCCEHLHADNQKGHDCNRVLDYYGDLKVGREKFANNIERIDNALATSMLRERIAELKKLGRKEVWQIDASRYERYGR